MRLRCLPGVIDIQGDIFTDRYDANIEDANAEDVNTLGLVPFYMLKCCDEIH